MATTRGREVKIYFSGDPSSAVRAFNTVDRKADTTGRHLGTFGARTSKMFRGMGRAAAIGVGAGIVAATAAVAAFGTFSVREAADAQKVAAQTNAVIKSTGGVAKVSAQEVDRLSTALANKSGVDDETIASGQNLLLTFTNIRSTFGEAARAALDMSVALGTDLNAAAMQVGKALNDPEKGMTRLTRVGVTFTEQQKKQVAAMVDAGRTADAQRIILAELRKEFGGSAKAAGDTFAGKLDKLKVAFGNVAENVGGVLIPYLGDFADWVNDHMPEIEKGIKGAIKGISTVLGGVVDAFKTLRRIAVRVADHIAEHWDEIVAEINSTSHGMIEEFGDIGDALEGLKKSFASTSKSSSNNWNALGRTLQAGTFFGRLNLRLLAEAIESIVDVTAATVRGTRVIIAGFKTLWNDLVDWFETVGERIVGKIILGIRASMKGIGDALKAAFNINLPTIVLPWSQKGDGIGQVGSLVSLGKALQANGYSVGEHPAFGGVAPVHASNSYHYAGRALDINWPGPGETSRLQELAGDLRQRFGGRIKELYYPGNDPYGGHDSHLHIAMAKGGIVTRPTRALIGEAGPEAVIPLSRGLGGVVNHFNITVNASGLYPEDVADEVLGAIHQAHVQSQGA